MSTVTITLADTPEGGVAVSSDYHPAPGQGCTAAQAAALDIISRTRAHWAQQARQGGGVDIDAIHRRADITQRRA